jgi:hypothetical protein
MLSGILVLAYGQVGKLWYGVQISNALGRFQQAGSSFSERDFGSGLYATGLILKW